MAEFKEKLHGWWEARAPQEKTTLKIALPVIGLMVLYLVLVEPIMNSYFDRKAEHQRAQDQLTWLYDQSSLVARMQNGCGSRIYYLQVGDTPLTLARSIARRTSISGDYEADGDSVKISVRTAPGNRMLEYIQQMICNGYQIEELVIQRLDSVANAVSGSMVAVPVALPRMMQQ